MTGFFAAGGGTGFLLLLLLFENPLGGAGELMTTGFLAGRAGRSSLDRPSPTSPTAPGGAHPLILLDAGEAVATEVVPALRGGGSGADECSW
ncbi:hypothetical protein M406DRAFT_337354 [Cryphonectria parasitica EP155]|uniref:Secreted protein n=1 Tax=Cryphonectria parasitica (strain ATCC 38755 / EP155) TaxID=660469 RepID=A0A9P4Y8S2_CRYP1|nr:uncharacterized protein M406DRAFT_337354 [Cryphonectria parasitica EP155]KAF3769059.1 hypothetical protein M406DRAFT_337354 [Cryphonectria parasitica EP155]